jgi:hypothetical protein
MDPALLGTASAFGLATSAGLNTTLPLFVVGLLGRLGFLTLTDPFSALSSNVALGALLVLVIVEMLGDKIPGVDSAVHAAQWPLAAIAGAILFASQSSVISWVSPELTFLVGLITAGGVHATRAAARPAVTATTLGVGNPVVSFAEDLTALMLTVGAVFVPLLAVVVAAVVVIGLAVLGIRAARQGVAASRSLFPRVRA